LYDAKASAGIYGIYRIDSSTCTIVEVICHEQSIVPERNLLNAIPEDIIPNSLIAELCRNSIIKAYNSGFLISITIPISIPVYDGHQQRSVHFSRDGDSVIAMVCGVPPLENADSIK
jgi:hypothetical protein